MLRSAECRPTPARLRLWRTAEAAFRSAGLVPTFALAALPVAEDGVVVGDFDATGEADSTADPTAAGAGWTAVGVAAASAAAPVPGLRAASEGTRGAGLRWLGCAAWPRRDCGDKAILLTMPGPALRWLAPFTHPRTTLTGPRKSIAIR